MKNYLIIVLLLTLANCASYNVNTELMGKWVEVNGKTDTLTFGLIGEKEYVTLGRGTEMRHGYLLPKSASGPYEYKLSESDTISLRWIFSSDINFKPYYFHQSGDKLTIGDFFYSNTSGGELTFQKIE